MTRRFGLVLTTRRLLLAVALSLGTVAFLVWHLVPKDTVTKVTPEQAHAEFHRLVRENPNRSKAVAGLPLPGVYRYSVTGSEHLDGLLSATHSYEGITRIVIVSRSCGFGEEWHVLRERWSAATMCPAARGELNLTRLREHHEFFGTVNDALYSCRPVAGESTRCSSPSGSISYSTHKAGTGKVSIAGHRLTAVHLRAHAVFTGESAGSGSIEEWRRSSDGLLLRKKVSISAEVASVGDGKYGEHYQLNLVAPNPTH